MSAEITTLGRLAISAVVAAGNTPGDPNLRLNFSRFAKGISQQKADANQTRGELSRRLSHVRTSQIRAQPMLEIQPTAVELARILDWTMGAAPSGSPITTYGLGNTTRRAKLHYDDNTTVWEYALAAVSRLTLRSSDTDPVLAASVAILARNCEDGATFPAGLANSIVDDTTGPFIHQDTSSYSGDTATSTITVGGSAILVSQIEHDFDMGLMPDRFFNSLYLTEFVKPDRHIGVRLTFPVGEHTALYDAAAADAGVAVVCTYTNGGLVLTLTYPAVQFPKEPIEVAGRTETMHQLNGVAYRTTGSEAVVVTLDSTP